MSKQAAEARLQVILDRLKSRTEFYVRRVQAANQSATRASDLDSQSAKWLKTEAKSQLRVSKRMFAQDKRVAVASAKHVLSTFELKASELPIYRKITSFKSKVLS